MRWLVLCAWLTVVACSSDASDGSTADDSGTWAAGSGGVSGAVSASGMGGSATSMGGQSGAGSTSADAATTGGEAMSGAGGHAASGSTATDAGSATDGGPATDASAGSRGASGCAGPVGTISGALATGVAFVDTDGEPVNAHGGGIIQVGDTFYMHGERFSSTTTDNNFNGFSMYSSQDLASWKNEGVILPQQAGGELGPNRKGERPHIIQCPSTGEFVLYAHAASADYQTDKEVVYATSATVNGQYSYRGPLTNAGGQPAAHSDMTAYADDSGAYVLTESGHVYTLATDCHGWLSDQAFGAINGDSGGAESPAVFRADGTYYWIGSYKTGWRANNNFYSTAPSITGPWTYRGFVAPVTDTNDNLSDERTWLSQSTWVQPVVGCEGTVYVYWGDHWDGNLDTTAPGRHNALATYVFQPLVFDGIEISMPVYQASWLLDVGAGTWAPAP